MLPVPTIRLCLLNIVKVIKVSPPKTRQKLRIVHQASVPASEGQSSSSARYPATLWYHCQYRLQHCVAPLLS